MLEIVEQIVWGFRRSGLLASESDDRVRDLVRQFVAELAEVGVRVGDSDATLGERLARERAAVSGVRFCSRTMTSSHSSSCPSVQIN